MCRAPVGSNTPPWIRNNIPDFQRAMSVKIAVENGKTAMGEGPWRNGEVWELVNELTMQ